MKRVISVWLPTWPTDRLRQMGSAAPPRNAPFVTIAKDGAKRVLASVDAAARRLKLYPGQALAFARAIVPDLAIAACDPRQDRAGLEAIAYRFIKLYSPVVGMPAFDTLWLDITGAAHLWGGEEALLRHLLTGLKEQGIAVRSAIADTPGSADALARWGPKAHCLVPAGGHEEALKVLPISALRLEPRIVDGLAQLGFIRIGQLYKTPRAPLVRRFGAQLMQRLDQALGQAREVFEPLVLPDIIEVRRTFADPVANPDYVRQAIERLALQLCQGLEGKGLGARRLDLRYLRVDGSLQAIRIGTVRASRDCAHFMRLFAEHFDKVDYGFGIEALVLAAPFVEPLRASQYGNGLGVREAPDLSGLVDLLQNRLGTASVYQAAAYESDVPERSVRRGPPLEGQISPGWPKAFPRPARLLRVPEKIEAMALLPDRAPLQFVWRRQRYVIKRSDGPERIFGEWWRDRSEVMAVRDYFQVEDEGGGRFWLFRRGDGSDPRTGSHEWFLHGFFG